VAKAEFGPDTSHKSLNKTQIICARHYFTSTKSGNSLWSLIPSTSSRTTHFRRPTLHANFNKSHISDTSSTFIITEWLNKEDIFLNLFLTIFILLTVAPRTNKSIINNLFNCRNSLYFPDDGGKGLGKFLEFTCKDRENPRGTSVSTVGVLTVISHAHKWEMFLAANFLDDPAVLNYRTDLLSNSTEKSASWEANSPSNSQEPVCSLPCSQQQATCYYTEPDQSNPPRPTSWKAILISSFYLSLGLPSGIFPSGFPTKIPLQST
jgi:hypothetical protein